MTGSILKQSQIEEFHRNGVLVIPGFYDTQSTIEPIQRGIYDVIGLLLKMITVAPDGYLKRVKD